MSLILKNKKFGSTNKQWKKIALVKGGKNDGEFVYQSEGHEPEGVSSIKMDSKGILQPLPDFSRHEKIYAAANSGAGKTFYIANWLKQWYKKPKNKDKPLYIFSSVEEDETLDSFPNAERIGIDSDLIDNPISLEDLSDSFILFDDIDTIAHPALRKIVLNLRDHALQTARHFGITMGCTSHVISNYSKTRILLAESTSVTFFPRMSGSFQIRKYLETQAGFDKEQIQRFLKQPSRWVTLYKKYNGYVISEKECYLIHDDF